MVGHGVLRIGGCDPVALIAQDVRRCQRIPLHGERPMGSEITSTAETCPVVVGLWCLVSSWVVDVLAVPHTVPSRGSCRAAGGCDV